MAKQNNELLIKNHEYHPTGLTTFPKVNVLMNKFNCGCGCGNRHSYSCGHDRGGSNSHLKWGKIKINCVHNDENSKYGDMNIYPFRWC